MQILATLPPENVTYKVLILKIMTKKYLFSRKLSPTRLASLCRYLLELEHQLHVQPKIRPELRAQQTVLSSQNFLHGAPHLYPQWSKVLHQPGQDPCVCPPSTLLQAR